MSTHRTTRGGVVASLGATLLLSVISAIPISAHATLIQTTLTLTNPPSSLVAVGSEASVIGSGTVIPTTLNGTALTFSMPTLPDVMAAGGDRFRLTLLSPVISATLTPATNTVTTAPFTIKIERFPSASSTPDLSGNLQVVLTTGSVTRPQCGSVGAFTTSGQDLQPNGSLRMIANMCIGSLGSDPVFNQAFTMRLNGVIATTPVPVPEPALGALLLACGGCVAVYARRRRARA